MKRLKYDNHCNGFSLIETIVALGISGIVLLVSSSILIDLYREKRRADLELALSEIRITIQTSVLNNSSWNQNQSSDPQMACFSGIAPSSCIQLAEMSPREFKIYAGGAVFYDSTNPNTGFGINGESCNQLGSKGCVIKPHATWQLRCSLSVDPLCLAPLVDIRLMIEIKDENPTLSNLDAYGFLVSKSTFPLQTASSCSNAIPTTCGPSQAAICQNGTWACEDFGL